MRPKSRDLNNFFTIQNCENYMDFGSEYSSFMKLLEFHRCELKNRLKSCIRYDMDRHRKEFQITTVRKLFTGLDDSTRRVAMATFFSNSKMRGPFNVVA